MLAKGRWNIVNLEDITSIISTKGEKGSEISDEYVVKFTNNSKMDKKINGKNAFISIKIVI